LFERLLCLVVVRSSCAALRFCFFADRGGGRAKIAWLRLATGVSKFISEIIEVPSQVVKNFRIRDFEH
jgi:hypothetical protein